MDFTNLKNYMNELTAWQIPGNTIRVFRDSTGIFVIAQVLVMLKVIEECVKMSFLTYMVITKTEYL